MGDIEPVILQTVCAWFDFFLGSIEFVFFEQLCFFF